MSPNDEYLDFAIKIAKEAGSIQMSYFGHISSIKKKSSNIDLLTNADIESEKHIINAIIDRYPDHSIISEESNKHIKSSDHTWVIDPLDGTTNFTHKLPIFAVSIGLMKKNTTICGVVYNPAANKCFYAQLKNGAYLNESKIRTTKCNTLNDSLLVTGFPYKHDKKYDLCFDIFKTFYDKTRGVRRLGAAALDLCFVAMGRFDGFWEFGLNKWDICAGSLILKEAGGLITDWNKNDVPNNAKRILASNGKIHNKMSKILTEDKYKILL